VGLNGTISASHVYADNGDYTVTVTVTDDDGGAKSDTFQVVVKNVAPTIDLISPNGGEIVHGIRQIRFKVSQLQGKALTIEAFLGALPVPLIEGSAVTPPANGSVLEVVRTFDSTQFADGKGYPLRLVAKVTSDPATQALDDSAGTFVIDNTPPVLTIPAGELAPILEQAYLSGTALTFHPQVFDALDPAPTLVVTGSRGYYPLGVTTVTFTLTDWGTNSTVRTAKITVRDTTKPNLSPGSPITKEATSPAGTPVDLQPTTSDICDTSVSLVNNAPALFPLGLTTVTFTATDDSANTISKTLPVTITDLTPPVLILPDPPAMVVEKLEAIGTAGSAVPLPLPTTSDNGWGPTGLACTAQANLVDAAGQPQLVTVLCGQALPANRYFVPGTTTVTYRLVDGSGNSTEKTYLVTVVDTIPPDVAVDTESPGNGPSDWTVTPVVIQLDATDAGDPDPGVVVSPPPAGTDGHVQLNPDGSVNLVYDEDGVYDVTITVTDADGNSTTLELTRFYVDLTPPVTTIDHLAPPGDPSLPDGRPVYFQGEQLTPKFVATDATAGLKHAVVRCEPGAEYGGVVTLVERTYPTSGNPPYGAATTGTLVCDDQEGLCTAGVFDLARIALGDQALVLRATDVLDHEQVSTDPFRLIDLAEGLTLMRGRLLAYLAATADEDTQAALRQIDGFLATGQLSLGHGYLGGALLRINVAIKAMLAPTLLAAVPELAADAEFLARGAVAQTRLYRLDVAGDTDDGVVASSYLQVGLSLITADQHSAAVLAAQNAFFYARNAERPFLATDIPSSIDTIHLLLLELDAYEGLETLPGMELIAEARRQLLGDVLWKYENMLDGIELKAFHMIHLLLDLQDLATGLFLAQSEGAWVRNWQWGLAQLSREAIDIAKEGIEVDVPEGHEGYCKIEEADLQYTIGMAWLDSRDVDRMMGLYASQNIRCLMRELYQIGQYGPA